MASNRRRLTELSMVPAVAAELGAQIDGATKSSRRLIELGVASSLARRLVVQMNAGVGDARALGEVGMVPALAKEVAVQIGGAVPSLSLQPGMTMDLDANSTTMYGGTYPADTAGLASMIDSVTGATFAQTGSAQCTFVANADNNVRGINSSTFSNRAYTLPNANLPPNFMNQASPLESTAHFMFTNSGSNSSQIFLNYSTGTGRLEVSTFAVNAGGAGGGGVTASGIALKVLIPTGTHVLSLTSTGLSVAGQSGSGLIRVYLDGYPITTVIGSIQGIGAAPCILFSTNQAGANCFVGTWMRYIYYPFLSLPARVLKDVQYLLSLVAKTASTKVAIVDGSSLFEGVNGASVVTYNIAQSLLQQTGKTATPCVANLAIGGISFTAMVDKIAEIGGYVTALGAANVIVFCGEGYNTLTTQTAAQAVAGNGVGFPGAVGYLRALIAQGVLPQNIYFHTVTGVGTARAGFAKYPAYAALVKAIPATYSDLALVNIIPIDTDPNLGLSPESTAAIDATMPYSADLTVSPIVASTTMTITASTGTQVAVGMGFSGLGTANVRVASLGTYTAGSGVGTVTLDTAVTFAGGAVKGSYAASIYGGYYGTTGVFGSSGGSDGLGHNSDGYNGTTTALDGVHRSSLPGWVDGVTGVVSGYPMWAYRWLRTIFSTFIP